MKLSSQRENFTPFWLPCLVLMKSLNFKEVKEFKSSCHNPETTVFTMFPYYGSMH